MKKLFGLMLALSLLVVFAGCSKEETKNEGRQIYAKSFIEEYEGNEVEITNVVIFNEDKTGMLSLQDNIPFTYNNEQIFSEDGNVMYDYSIDGYVLTIKSGDFSEEFTLADETILENLPELGE